MKSKYFGFALVFFGFTITPIPCLANPELGLTRTVLTSGTLAKFLCHAAPALSIVPNRYSRYMIPKRRSLSVASSAGQLVLSRPQPGVPKLYLPTTRRHFTSFEIGPSEDPTGGSHPRGVGFIFAAFGALIADSIFSTHESETEDQKRFEPVDPQFVDKEHLHAQCAPNLLKIIKRLEHGPIIERNKAKIFELGLEAVKVALSSDHYPRESLEILRHRDPNSFDHASEMTINVLANKPVVELSVHWTDYSNAYGEALALPGFNTTFVNFANMRLGGGWRSSGNVQEEQIAQRSPEFAMILAETTKTPLLTRNSFPGNATGGRFASIFNSANPLLITNLRFFLTQKEEVSTDGSLRNAVHYDAGKAFQVTLDAPAVNLVAMAAPELRPSERKSLYHRTLLSDLFNNAYSAFALVKAYDVGNKKSSNISSGLWGAGAFGHSPQLSIATQYLAARLVGVDLIRFTGIRDADKIHREVISVVDQLVEKHQSAPVPVSVLLEELLKHSITAGWRTN